MGISFGVRFGESVGSFASIPWWIIFISFSGPFDAIFLVDASKDFGSGASIVRTPSFDHFDFKSSIFKSSGN